MYSFADKEKFGRLAMPDLKEYSGKLILYGAGKVADVVDYVLRQQGVSYLCYCDTYRSGGIHNGHFIISPEELRDRYPGVPVLVTTIHHRSVMDILPQFGERQIMDSVPLLVEVDFCDWGKNEELMTEEWAVRTITSYLTTMLSARNPHYYQELSVLLTQKCNLRCLDCTGMVPLFPSPKHYSADVIIRSLKNLLSYDGVIFHDICLLGGEPLLYPDLDKILEFSLRESRKEQISIVTNGTLMPSENLIGLMQDPRFFIRLSDYGGLSRKMNELIECLEKNAIRYEVDNYSEWYENRKHLIEHCDEAEATRKYRLCTNIKYRILLDGRFFPCCKAAQMCQMGVFAADSENSIDCLETEGLEERLRLGLQYLESTSHINICHRCYGIPQIHPDTMVPPAIQAKGPLYLS